MFGGGRKHKIKQNHVEMYNWKCKQDQSKIKRLKNMYIMFRETFFIILYKLDSIVAVKFHNKFSNLYETSIGSDPSQLKTLMKYQITF